MTKFNFFFLINILYFTILYKSRGGTGIQGQGFSSRDATGTGVQEHRHKSRGGTGIQVQGYRIEMAQEHMYRGTGAQAYRTGVQEYPVIFTILHRDPAVL